MISVAEYLTEGYILMVKKDSAKKCCVFCIKNFLRDKRLQVEENENYLTIYSP